MTAFSTIQDKVFQARNNDEALNRFLTEYRPFIAATVKDHVGHYVNYGVDDELSIAMLAFTEAVKVYDPDKGPFLELAKRIIRLRLIDYYRKQSRFSERTVPLTIQEDQYVKSFDQQESMYQHKEKELNYQKKYEILAFKEELLNWNISFKDLVNHSPKQKRNRKLYIDIAQFILDSEDLSESFIHHQRLPIKAIEEVFKVNRKKIERGRIYIIACTLVLKGDYDIIKDYLKWR